MTDRWPSTCWSSTRYSLLLRLSLLFLSASNNFLSSVAAFGGEKAVFTTKYSKDWATYNVSHRQSVCERYDMVRFGQRELRNALDGMELRPLMAIGPFFHYDDENGIHKGEHGLMADLMDELAQRAGFEWRDSFGVMPPPESINATWTEMIVWAVETYDLAVNWWDQSIERMELGAAFLEPWYDGSLIMIDKPEPIVDVNKINLLNWTKPFEPSVWLLIVFTIFISGVAYQLIEHLVDEREGRNWRQWFADNLVSTALLAFENCTLTNDT